MFTKKDDNIHEKTSAQKQWIRKRLTVSAIILVVVTILFDLSPVGGNMRFYLKWISCGNKPVATDTELHIDGSQPRYYKKAATFPELRGTAKFFCTPEQAEKAGYSASPAEYDFPNL